MFRIYNYYRQYQANLEIEDFKSFYKSFSNEKEFGGEFSNYDHLVKHRFMNVVGIVWNAILRKNPKNILDVGCGNGSNLPLSRAFPLIDYHGLDYAEKAIENARLQYPNVIFHVEDAFNSRFPEKTFDLIILSNVLILYSENQDQVKLLSEISRIMNDEGVFILVVYNEAFLIKKSIQLSRLIGKLLSQNLPNDFDGVYFDNTEIRNLAKITGFNVDEYILTGHEYGILESVRYLNMSKYNRKFGKSESEAGIVHPQSVLEDIQEQAGSLKWLTRIFYFAAKLNSNLFAHYAVYILSKNR